MQGERVNILGIVKYFYGASKSNKPNVEVFVKLIIEHIIIHRSNYWYAYRDIKSRIFIILYLHLSHARREKK